MGPQPTSTPPERSQTMNLQSPVNPINSPGGPGQRPIPIRQQQNGYPPNNPNSFNPSQRSASNPVQPQPPAQNLPQPLYPDRRPYPQPQRVDSRQPLPPQFNRTPLPNRGYPPTLADAYKPVPNRGHPQDPASNADPYRTRSMATMTTPPFNPAMNNHNQAPVNSFRQQPYQSMGSRTTAQGRIVPERHDERAMSMTSYSLERDHSQTMSGRVIPNRRRESGQETPQDQVQDQAQTPVASPNSQTSTIQSPGSRTMSPHSTAPPPAQCRWHLQLYPQRGPTPYSIDHRCRLTAVGLRQTLLYPHSKGRLWYIQLYFRGSPRFSEKG